MSLVLDTGPIIALLNAGDPDHGSCLEMIEGTDEDLVIPAPVMGEVDYWCRKLLGLEALMTFVEDVRRGAYRWYGLDVDGLTRAVEIEQAYDDLDVGFVDAAVMTVCEQLDEEKVATLDRRHFSVMRPAHRPSLDIVP